MFQSLKKRACQANLLLPQFGLITLTFGNVSELDRKAGVFAIKPSGVEYGNLTPKDMVVVDLDGRVVDGRGRPSSDTPTHLELYRRLPGLGGIVHTHAAYSTAFAQAGREIPCFGTTHADNFYGNVPVTRPLTRTEVAKGYEKNTGLVIAECFRKKGLKPLEMPGVLVNNHGPFTWGPDAIHAVENAVVMEQCAQMAEIGLALNPRLKPIPQYLLDKHFLRKHGKKAYYGQG
jgi:L-ribulose-5-phosphate 4-epimerase